MAVQVVKRTGENEEEVVIERGSSEQKPEGRVFREVVLTAEVLAIDMGRGTVTLRGSDSVVRTVLVRRPDRLSLIKVGDLLEITCSEGLALSVQPAEESVR